MQKARLLESLENFLKREVFTRVINLSSGQQLKRQLCQMQKERKKSTRCGPAGAHRAAVLAGEAEADHTVRVVGVGRLAVLPRHVVAEAPSGIVALGATRVEPGALGGAVLVARHPKGVQHVFLYHALVSIRAVEELRGVAYRLSEGVYGHAVRQRAHAAHDSVE